MGTCLGKRKLNLLRMVKSREIITMIISLSYVIALKIYFRQFLIMSGLEVQSCET